MKVIISAGDHFATRSRYRDSG